MNTNGLLENVARFKTGRTKRVSSYQRTGGLCAAVPGPGFLINTDKGVRSIAANRVLSTGRHHLAGVYE